MAERMSDLEVAELILDKLQANFLIHPGRGLTAKDLAKYTKPTAARIERVGNELAQLGRVYKPESLTFYDVAQARYIQARSARYKAISSVKPLARLHELTVEEMATIADRTAMVGDNTYFEVARALQSLEG